MATRFVLKQNLPSSKTTDDAPIAEYIFQGSILTVGSDGANNLVVPASAPEHFVVVREGDSLTLINGAEGTRVNGQRLRREAMQPLADGDEIGVGDYLISVAEDAADSEQDADARRENTDEPLAEAADSAIAPGDSDQEAANQFPKTNETDEQSRIPKTIKSGGINGHPSARNFADILDALRTEEDSFYFVVKNGEREAGRIALEQTEMPIGVDAKGEIVSGIERISGVYALVRKDWSGILLESQKRGAVFVNGETLETARRLRNDDRVTFAAPVKFSLILHEPSSLVALESLLSARADTGGAARFGNLNPANAEAPTTVQTLGAARREKIPFLERRFFGYFNFIETITMVIATLIGAVLIFLLLEFTFS